MIDLGQLSRIWQPPLKRTYAISLWFWCVFNTYGIPQHQQQQQNRLEIITNYFTKSLSKIKYE